MHKQPVGWLLSQWHTAVSRTRLRCFLQVTCLWPRILEVHDRVKLAITHIIYAFLHSIEIVSELWLDAKSFRPLPSWIFLITSECFKITNLMLCSPNAIGYQEKVKYVLPSCQCSRHSNQSHITLPALPIFVFCYNSLQTYLDCPRVYPPKPDWYNSSFLQVVLTADPLINITDRSPHLLTQDLIRSACPQADFSDYKHHSVMRMGIGMIPEQ